LNVPTLSAPTAGKGGSRYCRVLLWLARFRSDYVNGIFVYGRVHYFPLADGSCSFLGIFLLVTLLVYRHGKKVGDQQGYMRGYEEAQQSIDASNVRTRVSAILNERPCPTSKPD